MPFTTEYSELRSAVLGRHPANLLYILSQTIRKSTYSCFVLDLFILLEFTKVLQEAKIVHSISEIMLMFKKCSWKTHTAEQKKGQAIFCQFWRQLAVFCKVISSAMIGAFSELLYQRFSNRSDILEPTSFMQEHMKKCKHYSHKDKLHLLRCSTNCNIKSYC